MVTPTAAPFVPHSTSLRTLATAARDCEGCDLYRDADRTVFGAGTRSARMMLVGEQPGDREDREGAPFVGPAGALLDRALVDAGIDRESAYLTNAVKHFRFRLRGKRRIHQTPTRTEVVACRPWLLAELDAVEPEVLVFLGATAAKSLMGSAFRLTQHRGDELHLPADAAPGHDPSVVATVHPSSVLRVPHDERVGAYASFVDDLAAARMLLG
ncbi:UdgX family uracil-DNA binding protein [Rhodococcus sp. HNM0569]|uniref:UdgX family uracil-DNA binding protein n=1 Tax=Rhodococcus sp. HNM0569 TaxID=2716340 RepID=UPI00146D3F19|nr:UdgX family uracil-DNA binding protein [Rhodococcus sp. HNM0569]NLU85079.1 UdgX family uracil-DNA binding protein [Rhodococcus sp. HNM0569]